MKSVEEMDAETQSLLLLDCLANKVAAENWCLNELGRAAGRSRRWVQRKLRGDTQLTIAEFFLIARLINWDVEVREVSK